MEREEEDRFIESWGAMGVLWGINRSMARIHALLVLADDEEMAKIISAEDLKAYKAELNTKPRVLYKNLHRWEKVFLSASVAYKDTDECAQGAQVTVSSAGSTVGEALVNNYGEFVVDELEPGGQYEVVIEAAGYEPYSAKAKLDRSLNLGTLFLERGGGDK